MRLAGARDRVRPDLVRLERQAERGEALQRGIDVTHAGEDEVLLPRETDVAADLLGEIRDGDELVAGGETQADGHSDGGEPVLALGMHANVRGGMR